MPYFIPDARRGVFLEFTSACRRRSLDCERFRSFLSANGFHLCPKPEDADILVFYGCCLNGSQTTASLQCLSRQAASFPDVVILGGMAKICDEPTLTKHVAGKIHRVTWDAIDAIDALFANRTSLQDLPFGNHSPQEKEKWSIMVGHGCDSGCTYCGDKPIVGSLRSCDLESIAHQMRVGLERGFKHFDLVGDDVGAWGRDFGANVTQLLDVATSFPGNYCVSMQEVNIKYLIRHVKEFERMLGRGKISFLVMAFQHISDRILKLMRRGYTRSEVIGLMNLLKRYDVRPRFHSLIGFPSETRPELNESLQFLCDNDFVSGSCFLYQPVKYAPSSALPGHFTEEEQYDKMEQSYSFLSASKYIVEQKWPNGSTLGPPYKLLVTARSCVETEFLEIG